MGMPHRSPVPAGSTVPGSRFEEAWRKVGELYPAESWFRDVHLAENKGRIRRIVGDVSTLVPPAPENAVVDVGCYNGFLCYLLHQLGYSTAGMDALADEAVPERAQVLESIGAPFHFANFNGLDPFADCPKDHYSAAILGEVFEHILNHPLGLLAGILGILRPGGILILTTPNPHTLANVVRLLRGRSIVWGDREFASMPKVAADGQIISYEGIHYREYSQALLAEMVTKAGFEVIRAEYLGSTAHARQPWINRAIKATPVWAILEGTRLFGAGNYLVCRRPR